MPISEISAANAVATTLTMPTHTTGDYIVGIAWAVSATIPSLPAGWTNSGSLSGVVSIRIGYKIAASGSETMGTWTNAALVAVEVLRGATGVGTPTMGNASSNVVAWPALTMTTLAGTSWVLRAAAHGNATDLGGATPAGYTSRTSQGGVQVCDTNAGITSNPTLDNQSVNNTAGWSAMTLEIQGPSAASTQGMLAVF